MFLPIISILSVSIPDPNAGFGDAPLQFAGVLADEKGKVFAQEELEMR